MRLPGGLPGLRWPGTVARSIDKADRKILSQERGDIESIVVYDMGDSFRTLAGMHPYPVGDSFEVCGA